MHSGCYKTNKTFRSQACYVKLEKSLLLCCVIYTQTNYYYQLTTSEELLFSLLRSIFIVLSRPKENVKWHFTNIIATITVFRTVDYLVPRNYNCMSQKDIIDAQTRVQKTCIHYFTLLRLDNNSISIFHEVKLCEQQTPLMCMVIL